MHGPRREKTCIRGSIRLKTACLATNFSKNMYLNWAAKAHVRSLVRTHRPTAIKKLLLTKMVK